jgi:glyoxylase-like metal-dependent hydrolase (beta-lactamase superfamily II)
MSGELEIRSYTLGDLATNCYIAWCPKTYQAVVIDPADSGDFISQTLLDLQLELTGIVLTHAHFDHCLGLLELKLNFNVPVFMHPADLPLLKTATDSAQHWLKRNVDPVPLADAEVVGGSTLAVGHQHLTVVHAPGHTPGSIALFNAQAVFSGDTWFKDGVGSTQHRYSSRRDLFKSLVELRKIAKGKKVYPGHGEEFWG